MNRSEDYPTIQQKVKFLVSERKEDVSTHSPLQDRIFLDLSQEAKVGVELNSTSGSSNNEKGLKSDRGKEMNRPSEDEITESEEEFDLNEEFHPPNNPNKIYQNIGSLLLALAGSLKVLRSPTLSKGLEKSDQSEPLKISKGQSSPPGIFSRLLKSSSSRASSGSGRISGSDKVSLLIVPPLIVIDR